MFASPRNLVTALVASALSLAGATAHAQFGASAQIQYGAPPPVYAQPQPVYAHPQPVYQQLQSVYPQQPAYQRPFRRVGRFRYGGDVGGGWAFLGPLSGGGITASLRLGWQIDDNWAVYYQGDLPIAFAAGEISGRTYGGAAIVLGTGILGEYTLGDILSLGIGPSLDYAAIGTSTSTGGVSTTYGEGGTYFGVQARVMITLIASSNGAESRRRGFRIGASSHTTFFSNDVFQAINLHLGYEWY